ncbi:MAG: acyltransferase family protein [Deltaproteobacteria bacterium]|nr:acyltransferase family protein [Deltaproteobacteria bacterium]
MHGLLRPWRKVTRPVFVGIEHVPDERPLLFVGNHTLFGVIDVPLMFFELWRKRGIFLRALGHHGHFKVPVWGDFLRRFGVIDGTRENCAALMAAGEAVLVFPGGSREVAKRKGERYRLFWKDRLGFAKMALRHRCTIVPFGAVGADDAYDIVVDGDDLLRTPVGKLGRKLGVLDEDFLPPIVRGHRGTPLPKPERLYFRFEPPIGTAEWDGRDDETAARAVRDRTRAAIEHALTELLALRARHQR